MMRFRFKYDWNEFNPVPDAEDEWVYQNLPLPDGEVYSKIKKFTRIKKEKTVMKAFTALARVLLDRLEKKIYSRANVSAVFKFACQLAAANEFRLDEYSKNDDILTLFYQTFYDIDYYDEITRREKFCEVSVLIDLVENREETVQKFSAFKFDFRTEYVLLAKLCRDDRLKSYLIRALHFYETVHEDELLFDRETDIENIIEGLGVEGWTEFTGVVSKYLKSEDQSISMTAINTLGRIGGEEAYLSLKSFSGEVLKGKVELDKTRQTALEMNLLMSSLGFMGVIVKASRRKLQWWKKNMAINLLTGIKKPEIIKFLYKMMSDMHIEVAEVRFITGDDTYTTWQKRFPVREEALFALETYDEDYVVSILGEKYLRKRESFYSQIEKIYRDNRSNMGIDELDIDYFDFDD